MKTVLKIIITLIGNILQSLCLAWTFQKIWAWFVARDLGAGPSMAGWYGITTILVLIATLPVVFRLTKKSEEAQENTPLFATSRVVLPFAVAFSCLIILGHAWLLGHIVGWL